MHFCKSREIVSRRGSLGVVLLARLLHRGLHVNVFEATCRLPPRSHLENQSDVHPNGRFEKSGPLIEIISDTEIRLKNLKITPSILFKPSQYFHGPFLHDDRLTTGPYWGVGGPGVTEKVRTIPERLTTHLTSASFGPK